MVTGYVTFDFFGQVQRPVRPRAQLASGINGPGPGRRRAQLHPCRGCRSSRGSREARTGGPPARATSTATPAPPTAGHRPVTRLSTAKRARELPYVNVSRAASGSIRAIPSSSPAESPRRRGDPRAGARHKRPRRPCPTAQPKAARRPGSWRPEAAHRKLRCKS
jgi:hypothetical protein